MAKDKKQPEIISATKVEQVIKPTPPPTTNKVGEQTFMFSKQNYTIMLVGLAVIALGFILMSGGKSLDPHVFNKEEVYSFRRITLAPILVILGFAIEGVAIMWLPKEK